MASSSSSSTSSAFEIEFVDGFYFSALLNVENELDEHVSPISDYLFAEELQLQEVLAMSSNSASRPESVEEDESSSHGFCQICIEKKESDEMFRIDACSHSFAFCSDCVTTHISMKIHENVPVVNCPGVDCSSVLELEKCRPILSTKVAEMWDKMLCESVIPAEQKLYCPFNDCSVLLVKDSENDDVAQSECPYCHRLLCARCLVRWHVGIECNEFQKLNEDEREREDLMVRELAKSNSWMRCPSCRFYVEKTEGCLHIRCRCGFEFCYACGATWTEYHGGCQPPPA